MKKIFLKKIITLSFIALLIPILFTTTNSQINNQINTQFTTQGNDSYIEDFTTLTYRGSGTTASGWGNGAITNTRSLIMAELDSYVTTNPIRDIEVQGRKVYGALHSVGGTRSISIYDISDPYTIVRTGFRSSMGYQQAIAVEGDAVYVGRGGPSANIATYTFTDPYSSGTHHVNTLVDGVVTDVETNGYLVYYTVYKSGSGYSFRLLNAENPAVPIAMTPTWMDSNALGIAIDGNLAYVAASHIGFYVLDVSDQNNFIELGFLNVLGNATDVIVDGRYAYLAAGEAGMHVIDIFDPAHPTIVGSIDTSGDVRRLVKQGNTLYLAAGDGGIVILDVSNPTNPLLIPFYPTVPYVWDVDLYGDILVVATDNGLYTFKYGYGVSNSFDTVFDNPYTGFPVLDVAVRGNIAYCAGGPAGLYTLDVSDPNDPILLDNDTQSVTADYRRVELDGNHAYVSDYGGGGIRSYDISDPTNIISLDNQALGQAMDIAISGDIAIVADGTLGVYFYNITDPSNLAYTFTSITSIQNDTTVEVQGPHLYIATDCSSAVGFYVYDVSDMSSPTQLYTTGPFISSHSDLFVDGDDAFVVDQLGYSVFWNVTDPTTVFFDGVYASGLPTGVWGFGPYMLVADQLNGLNMFDTSNPSSLTVQGNYPGAKDAIQVTTHGDYTYVANITHLTILRHTESIGDTYNAGTSIAQSSEIDSITGDIKQAMLTPIQYLPPGTNVDYFMSVDGGTHWEPVTPGIVHEFVNFGDDLRWRATILGPSYRSAHIYQVNIDYEYNEAPTIPSITELGDKTFGSFKVDWSDSTDDVKLDHYILQMSDTLGFIEVQKEWTSTKSQQSVMLGKGTFYFRVQAVDDEGLPSAWSLVKVANANVSAAMLWIIIGGGALVLISAIVIPVVLVLRKKKGKVPTR